MAGFIKIDRNIVNNEFYFMQKFTYMSAWIDLLILAQWKPSGFEIRGNWVAVERGQIARSLESLCDRWKWGKKTVIEFLKTLEKSKQITVKRTTVINTITIINYNKYQIEDTTDRTTDRTTDKTTDRTHKKKDKNSKEYIYFYQSIYYESYDEFFKYVSSKEKYTIEFDVNKVWLEIKKWADINKSHKHTNIKSFISNWLNKIWNNKNYKLYNKIQPYIDIVNETYLDFYKNYMTTSYIPEGGEYENLIEVTNKLIATSKEFYTEITPLIIKESFLKLLKHLTTLDKNYYGGWFKIAKFNEKYNDIVIKYTTRNR